MCRYCLFQRKFEGFRIPACWRERQHVEAAAHSAEVNHATFGRHLAPCRDLARHSVLQFVGNVLGSLLRCHRLHGLETRQNHMQCYNRLQIVQTMINSTM